MPDVVALGDVNVDIIAHFASYPDTGEDALASSTEFHCGGSAANTAMALARMGLDVMLISRVGPDSLALKALNSLNEAGVMPGGLQRDAAAMTGLMYVVVTPDGERTILGHRGANVLTDPNQIRDMRDVLRKLSEEKTILLSTHILQEVEAMASRVVMINEGHMVYDGTVSELGANSDELEQAFHDLTATEAA